MKLTIFIIVNPRKSDYLIEQFIMQNMFRYNLKIPTRFT